LPTAFHGGAIGTTVSQLVRARGKDIFFFKDQLLTLALAAPGPEFVDFEIARDHWKLAREMDARITTTSVSGLMDGRQVQEMGEAGLLRDDTTYIHCTTLNETEIQMIVDTAGRCRCSACRDDDGHGMPPVQKFLDGIEAQLERGCRNKCPR